MSHLMARFLPKTRDPVLSINRTPIFFAHPFAPMRSRVSHTCVSR